MLILHSSPLFNIKEEEGKGFRHLEDKKLYIQFEKFRVVREIKQIIRGHRIDIFDGGYRICIRIQRGI